MWVLLSEESSTELSLSRAFPFFAFVLFARSERHRDQSSAGGSVKSIYCTTRDTSRLDIHPSIQGICARSCATSKARADSVHVVKHSLHTGRPREDDPDEKETTR
ncbi:unnamed protein product [Pylaiella littoralis]